MVTSGINLCSIPDVTQRISNTVVMVAFFITILIGGSILTQPIQGQEPKPQISEARIGSLKFKAILGDSLNGLPALPDLSYPRTVRIPGTASIEQVLPVLWNGVLIPPGLHRVEIKSFSDREPQLVVIPYGGGAGIHIPATRGILDRPAGSIRWTISSVTTEGSKDLKDARLQLDLRWGILQLACEGIPLPAKVIKAGRWSLETHDFPASTGSSDRRYLGSFEDPRLSPNRWRCLLDRKADGSYQLVLLDPSRDRRAASHQEWWDRLRKSKSRLRQLQGESTSEAEAKRKQLQKEIDRAQKMVTALDEALQNLDDESRQKSLKPYGSIGPGRSGLEVDLKISEEGAFLHVVCKEGRFRFLVSETL